MRMDYNGVDKNFTFALYDSITGEPINSPASFTCSAFVLLYLNKTDCDNFQRDCEPYSVAAQFSPGTHRVTVDSIVDCRKCTRHPYLRRGVLRVNETNLFWSSTNPDSKVITGTFTVRTGLYTNCEVTLCTAPPIP
jgi:hypothetical protein